VTIYSIKFMESDARTPIFFTLLLAMISGMVGVVSAADLFTLFVFWELMSIASYVLVAFRKEEWEPVEAGFKYLIMSAAGSATTLFGISLLYGMTGTLNFVGLAQAFGQSAANPWLYLASLFIFAGFGVKAAVVPLHTWLPDAYSAAPTPISAILSGVVTEIGIYALCRTFFTAFLSIQANWSIILAGVSIVTMVVGNIMALLQNDVKRLLAYSSIGHIGYMLIGLSVGTQIGLTGTFLHIFNHALMKATAFLCSGAIIYRLETRRLEDMEGIGRRMPLTTIMLGISLFALIGMPPLNGFVSELTLFTSTVQAGMSWLGIALILSSVLSAAYYLRMLRVLIQPIASEKIQKVKEAPKIMLLPMIVMTGLIILFGIWPDPVIKMAQQAATGLLSIGR
jgi:proton-translocating NADH-quinone oxidoreductase chain N